MMKRKLKRTAREILEEYFSKLEDEGVETITYRKVADDLDMPYNIIYKHLTTTYSYLFDKYFVKLEKSANTKTNPRKRGPSKDYVTPPEQISEETFKDGKNLEEPVWDATDKDGNHTIVLMRDLLYRIANGKLIPKGYETYWKDGKIPLGLGYEGCVAANVGIRKKGLVQEDEKV